MSKNYVTRYNKKQLLLIQNMPKWTVFGTADSAIVFVYEKDWVVKVGYTP